MGYSNTKPECYGDPELYDPDDDECASCGVNHSCSIRAQRKSTVTRRSSYRSISSRNTTPTSRSTSAIQKGTRIEQEPEENVTFSRILMHNTGLEVLQTVVDELSSSIRHIPRLDYGKYFERKKK